MTLSENSIRDILEIKKKYPTSRAALMPALYIAQKEFGWLSSEAIEAVSETLEVPRAIVKGVATFYAMYKNRPMGRHLIQICTNVSCMIFGAEQLVTFLEKRYGLIAGGTSPDGRFSLVIMECIGACDRAPAMFVNEDFFSGLNEQNIVEILEEYK